MLYLGRDLCRIARAATRFGQSVATSMELGVSRSRFLGIGLEYADFREYQEGDDVRYVDWRITARSLDPSTGSYKLYVKVFYVEQMRNVILVADLTNSMLIEDKISSMFYTASLILELSHRLLDKITLVIVGREVEVIQNLRGRDAVKILENTICREKNVGGDKKLSNTLKIVKPIAKKRTSLIILTDYAHDIEDFKILSKIRKTMLIPVAVYINIYRWEIEKPVDRATAALIDVENLVETVENLNEVYKAIKTHVNYIKTLFTNTRVNYLEIQGLNDAKTKTSRIAEVFLKTRQAYIIT
ncbi:MAG: DUF58 domain-containing protein [Desulfurococcaceae archaeon]|nr:DUF58 domain-containing protein [Desulfurococcaceae archaeon]